MIAPDSLLAKSHHYGNLSLPDHTKQVVAAIRKFAQHFAFPFDETLAMKGAVLHDLGKAHPHFQRKIQGIDGQSLSDNRDWDFTHRHEISSLAFLPLFPENEWPVLIDLVIAHHKPIVNDAGNKGILDLKTSVRKWKENHLMDWEQWQVPCLQIVADFNLPVKTINRVEAENALTFVVRYCENKTSGWSGYRGLLKAADHFASAFMFDTQKQLQHLFEIPDLSFYHQEKRKHPLFPLSLISTDLPQPHTLVVAPTGAGKTDFLLRRCRGRVFYTLPFQASINAMYHRMKATVPNKDIRLLHATSRIVVQNRVEEQILQPLAGSAVKVLTPHQLAAIIFGTSGYETVMLDVQGTDVILDEIHTYSDFSGAMVIEIVKALLRLQCRLHIGTATMPSALYNSLLQILGGPSTVYEVALPASELSKFNRHQIYKLADSEPVTAILQQAFDRNEKVLLIYNTIAKAQEAFILYSTMFNHIPALLLHSRFRRKDRVLLEARLTDEFNPSPDACLLVATQVVEVSLDISFDLMITQCAPLDSMIQRFGRVNRKRTELTIGKYKPIYVLAPTGNVLPYKMEVLQKSFDQLPDHGAVLEENSLQEKIDAVYPSVSFKEIDFHLIYRNGRYTLKELTDCKSAVLAEALDIESAVCILESDRDNYLNANWEQRVQLEIPVSYKSIARFSKVLTQLQVGNYPFVIPQNLEHYAVLGLQIQAPDALILHS